MLLYLSVVVELCPTLAEEGKYFWVVSILIRLHISEVILHLLLLVRLLITLILIVLLLIELLLVLGLVLLRGLLHHPIVVLLVPCIYVHLLALLLFLAREDV